MHLLSVVSLAVRRTAYSDPEDTEDTIQEVFIQLQSVTGLRPDSSLQAYVLK